jgi:hypothetical protein
MQNPKDQRVAKTKIERERNRVERERQLQEKLRRATPPWESSEKFCGSWEDSHMLYAAERLEN